MNNPWLNLPEYPPYVLGQDAYVINEMNYVYGGTDRQIHTRLLPEPCIGNVAAPILLLTKNPGVDAESDPYWHTREDFKVLMKKNIQQEPLDYPFIYLDPQIADSPGARWHEGKLKWLIQAASRRTAAYNICSIPFFPYHTVQFSGIPKKITEDVLPSQRYTQFLIRKAIERDAAIVITLYAAEWEKLVPELRSYVKAYKLNSQNTSISPNNSNHFADLLDIMIQ